MALRTKCILLEPAKEDGMRISVMSRHTLEDGKTPDSRIRKHDVHMAILGPSPQLIGDYYKRGLPWKEFERRYLEEIKSPKKAEIIGYLARLALRRDITLLCIEETPEFCHRRLLVEEFVRHEPTLRVVCQ